jgi:rhamnulokinase
LLVQVTSSGLHLAIDLGAGGGRAILGRVGASALSLEDVHRFHYSPRPVDGHLRWDFPLLSQGILEGIRRAQWRATELGLCIDSVGVDSWGVDYGLVDGEGRLIEDPVAYRDERTRGVMDAVCDIVPRREIFVRTGIQFLPFNTLYQLFAHARQGLPPDSRLLLIPDLCHHMLSGSLVTERTNASTTQMLRLGHDGLWDEDLLERLGLPLALMPAVVPAGTELGSLLPRHRGDLGVGPVRVIAPATHDTASAVAGTPLEPGWAYISSGTWALMGVETRAPLLGEDAARENFTNEAGAFGTTRFLKNVMGLWILEECRREWAAGGGGPDRSALLESVAAARGFPGFIFPDAPRFFSPASMTAAVNASLVETGQAVPCEPALVAKVILDSLALRFASVLRQIEALTGHPVPGIHVVGGGARNAYLNQAVADATNRPVVAGPVEATATGNVLVQAIACGALASLAEGRDLVRRTFQPRWFRPQRPEVWADAATRYLEIESNAMVGAHPTTSPGEASR